VTSLGDDIQPEGQSDFRSGCFLQSMLLDASVAVRIASNASQLSTIHPEKSYAFFK